jgi:hypothetical protein
MLRRAIKLFVQYAYCDGVLPDALQQRLTALETDRPLPELLDNPPFEHYLSESPFRCTVYAIKLGSTHYPHLKMEIRPFPNDLGFFFWVDTHDQFGAFDEKMRGYADWCKLGQRNRELKQTIESAWAEHHLPTFAQAFQENASRQSLAIPPFAGLSSPEPAVGEQEASCPSLPGG